MPPFTFVHALAAQLGVWESFVLAVNERLGDKGGSALVDRIGALPVKVSRATGLLGSYVHRGGEPLHVRLQMQQEEALLRTTLLHELAHACEHLTASRPHRHRCGHGPAWRVWALALGIAPQRGGRSDVLGALRRERLKPVARCERCGLVFHRLRRLPARRHWVHPGCGNGRIVPLPEPEGGRS